MSREFYSIDYRTMSIECCDYCQVKNLKKNLFKKCFRFFLSGGSTTISSYSDIEKFRSRCGPAHGVMICQAAMWNPSIFRSNGLLPLSDVARRFLELVILSYSFTF
jgi:tRNA-dihydrouridine synthase